MPVQYKRIACPGAQKKTFLTNGGSSPTTKTLISKIDYNEIGQVLNKHLHSTDSTTFLQNIAYTYNERGWLWSSSAPLFAMTLYYNTSAGNKAYNGNIMYQYWGTPSGMTHVYNYAYDKLNRLMYGVLELTPSGTITNSEQGIAYDQMGNISTLIRLTGSTQIDNLAYNYTGNQLHSVYDNTGNNSGLVAGAMYYTYDGNGNVLTQTNTSNQTQSKIFTYNMLNLPQSVADYIGTLTSTYDATGQKLRRKSTGLGNTTDYISGIQYDGATTPALSFIQTEEGKAVPNGTSYDYVYYLGDNLGNTRVTFGTKTGTAKVYQRDNYYPFGYEINDTLSTPKNEYLYNKKELQEETQEYDYGARFYDPIVGRWWVVDPLSEKSRRWSCYNYVEDNPVRLIDPDGMGVKDDYRILKNGDIKLIKKTGASTDQIVKTDSKGNEKLDSKGNAKPIIKDIAKGILNPDKVNNFQNQSNVIDVGGINQPTADQVHDFVMALSDYKDVEIGGYDFSKKGESGESKVFIGAYAKKGFKPNDSKDDYSKFDRPEILQTHSLKTYFHTHLSRFGDSERLNASDADKRQKKDLQESGLKKAIILTTPEGPQEF